MLPDNYLQKMKQDLCEVEAQVEAETRYKPVLDDPPPPGHAGLTSEPAVVVFA